MYQQGMWVWVDGGELLSQQVQIFISKVKYKLKIIFCSVWTPRGLISRQMGFNEVRRTQSGRCIIPPLAHWAGQKVHQDTQGNIVISFASQAAEQYFAQIAQEELHTSVSWIVYFTVSRALQYNDIYINGNNALKLRVVTHSLKIPGLDDFLNDENCF